MADTLPIPREQWNLIDPEGAVRATEDTCIKAWARINGYKPTVEGLLGYEQQGWRVRSALTQQAEGAKCRPEGIPCGMCEVGTYSELAMATPLADALRALPADQRKPPQCKSADRPCVGAADFIADLATPPSPSAETAHRQGCDALGGYGNGIGPCTCGAQPSGEVLTKEEIRAVEHSVDWNTSREVVEFARAIERATLAKIGARHG